MARIRHIKNLTPSMYPKYRIKVGGRGKMITTKRGKKMRLPEQWGHFKVVTNDKDTNGNFTPAKEINDLLGDKPTELNVALSFDNPLLSIFSRYLCWQDSNPDPVFCEGDGEKASRWIAEDKREWIDCNDVEPCPYFSKHKCKLDARLVVRLLDAKDRPVKALFKTTSANALGDWLECCYDVALASGGILKDIPLKMVIKPYQNVKTDSTTGQAKMMPISYIVGLEQAENNERVLEIANEARKMRALSGIDQKLLESGQMEFQAKLLTAIPEEDGDEPEYYNGDEPQAENGEPLVSEKTGETWESVQALMETIKLFSGDHWPDMTHSERMVEIGTVKAQGPAALISLYEDIMAAREQDMNKAFEETGGEVKDGSPKESLPNGHDAPPSADDPSSPPASDPLTADLMIAHFPEVTNFHHLRQYMAKMAEFYNGLSAADKKRVQAAKKKRENEFTAEGQTSSDQDKMF